MKRTITVVLMLLLMAGSVAARKSSAKASAAPAAPTEAEQNAKYYYYEALRLLDEGETDKALLLLRHCEVADPGNASVHMLLGGIYRYEQAYGNSLVQYSLAVALEPDNWNYRRAQIEALNALGQTDAALGRCREAVSRDRRNTDAWHVLALLYEKTNQPAQALKAYNELERLEGIDSDNSLRKVNIHLRMGNARKALAEVDRLVDEYPAEAGMKALRARVLSSVGRKEEAMQACRDIISSNPHEGVGYLTLAELYTGQNDTLRAVNCVLDALNNRYIDIRSKLHLLGNYLSTFSTLKETRLDSVFTTLIDQYPLDEKARVYYATYLGVQEQYLPALEQLQVAASLKPDDENVWEKMVETAINTDSIPLIEQVTRQAMEHVDESPLLLYYHAQALARMDSTEAAARELRRAIEITPGDQLNLRFSLYSLLGDLCFQGGDRVESGRAYEEALRIQPTNPMVLNNYAYHLALDSTDLKRAERMSAKSLEAEPSNAVYLDTYAWILFLQGNRSLARFYIERAVDNLEDFMRDDPEIWQHYRDIMLAVGNLPKAQQAQEELDRIEQKQHKEP